MEPRDFPLRRLQSQRHSGSRVQVTPHHSTARSHTSQLKPSNDRQCACCCLLLQPPHNPRHGQTAAASQYSTKVYASQPPRLSTHPHHSHTCSLTLAAARQALGTPAAPCPSSSLQAPGLTPHPHIPTPTHTHSGPSNCRGRLCAARSARTMVCSWRLHPPDLYSSSLPGAEAACAVACRGGGAHSVPAGRCCSCSPSRRGHL